MTCPLVRVESSPSDLSFSYITFTNVGAIVFGAYRFRSETSSWWIFLLMNMKCPSLYCLINFDWKSILLDTRIATLT